MQPEWERKIAWMKEIADADRARLLGDLASAKTLLERVIDEARTERVARALGSVERGACTDVIGRAMHLLNTLG